MSLYSEKILLKEINELEFILKAKYHSVVIQKDDKLYDQLLNELQDALVNTYDSQRKKALEETIDYLVKLDRENFTKEDVIQINELIFIKLSKELFTILSDDVNILTEKVFKLGLNEVLKPLNIKFSFSLKDTEAASILGEHSLFWVENFYGEQLQSQIDDVLNSYFTSKTTIEEVAKDFEFQFNNKTKKGIEYFEGLAEHTTNRIREIGKVSGFEKAGIEYYQVKAIIDDRTSDICRRMNNIIFPVQRAIEFKNKILSLKSPEEVKAFAPWMKASDIKEIKDKNLPSGLSLPPYHWRCRTIVIAYFK